MGLPSAKETLMRRTVRALAVITTAAGALVATATSASAATPISPPTITAPLGGLGPYAVGSTVTFTFSGSGVGTPVAYEYSLNGGKTKTVHAPDETASIQVVIPQRQMQTLAAWAVAADGSVSGETLDEFVASLSPPAADKDVTGDGVPDLLTVGDSAGLGPGLWLAAGVRAPGAAAKGRVKTPAADIGINGDDINIPGSPSDWNGAQVVTGQFMGRGFQDLLVYFASGNDAGGGVILDGPGDGSALPGIANYSAAISQGSLADGNGDNPLQVVNAYGSIYGTGLPDILAINGDPANGYYLDYYEEFAPGGFFNTFSIHAPTPDGTNDWNQWTLATADGSSGISMFLWNESTGALYLWNNVSFSDNGDGTGNISYTQYQLSAKWNQGQPLATLEAADFGGSPVPGLWAVTPGGSATAYTFSDLSTTGVATVKAHRPQQL
jgi:hypothetical protein